AAREVGLPDGLRTEFAGNARAFQSFTRGIPLLILAAVLALIVVRARTGSQAPRQLAVPSTTPSLPTGTTSPSPSPRPWPTAPGACGPVALVPMVSSTPPAERTGIKVSLGGDRIRLIDFDTGQATPLPDDVVHPGEYAAVLSDGPVTAYATTGSCDETDSYGMLRISGNGQHVVVIKSIDATEDVLADRNHAWIVSYPNSRAAVTPADGGPTVRMPAGCYPSAIVSNTVVGLLQPDPSAPPTWLLLVDARTGRVRARLDHTAWPLAAGAGQVFWTTGCREGEARPCTLHRHSITGTATATYPLPRTACCGVVSPDRKKLALLLQRATTDQRFSDNHPMPPSDLAVLNLITGRLNVVPGIELPAKSPPGLAFTEDGTWLVTALDAGQTTRVLAWRPGLQKPYETTAIPGLVRGPPTLVITTQHGDR
ncbi:MAG: hypothetical protein HOV83_05675, partial [Catenulispora sp.]|nr:hypothetical protein [Catenulispora sp.]